MSQDKGWGFVSSLYPSSQDNTYHKKDPNTCLLDKGVTETARPAWWIVPEDERGGISVTSFFNQNSLSLHGSDEQTLSSAFWLLYLTQASGQLRATFSRRTHFTNAGKGNGAVKHGGKRPWCLRLQARAFHCGTTPPIQAQLGPPPGAWVLAFWQQVWEEGGAAQGIRGKWRK